MKEIIIKILSVILSITIMVTVLPLIGVDLFTSANAKTLSKYSVGDIVEFGSYPQSKVIDEALLIKLNSLELNWISYDYYSGTGTSDDGKMSSSDYMKYADITYNGSKYRAVKFTKYRPLCTGNTASTGYTYQDNNGYYTNAVYWFKYEPLQWRVLDPNEGFMMCESIIDSQPYSNTLYYNGSRYYQDVSCTNYASNYVTSSIRDWLNDDFYNTAFTSSEKVKIQNFIQDNSCGSLDYPQYDSNITYDKIFLLSYDEANNSEFGFSTNSSEHDTGRRAQGTDYAKAQGLGVYNNLGSACHGKSQWWLRSSNNNFDYACEVDGNGYSSSWSFCGFNYTLGVRPALKFNPKSNIYESECEHKYETTLTAPTCTEKGYTTYTCACGNRYISDYVSAVGHNISGFVVNSQTGVTMKKCLNCDYTEETEFILQIEEMSWSASIVRFREIDRQTGEQIEDDTVSYSGKVTKHNIDGLILFAFSYCAGFDTYEEVAKYDGYTPYAYSVPLNDMQDMFSKVFGIDNVDFSMSQRYDPVNEIYYGHLGHGTAGIMPVTTYEDGKYIVRWYGVRDEVTNELSDNPHQTIVFNDKGQITGIYFPDIPESAPESEHTYESVTIPPTCTEQGYTLYTCPCGDSYVDNYVDAIGHIDNDGNGYCDADNELLDLTLNCGCNCHKSGIRKFFFKFALFFQRIFGANKNCGCGVTHY